jgi:dienelactone hydrolase
VQLDTSKIAVSGHSFGGVTSVLAAHEDPRISACLSIDPWFFPILKNLDSIKVAKPLLMVMSEKFSRICTSFDVWKSLN